MTSILVEWAFEKYGGWIYLFDFDTLFDFFFFWEIWYIVPIKLYILENTHYIETSYLILIFKMLQKIPAFL